MMFQLGNYDSSDDEDTQPGPAGGQLAAEKAPAEDDDGTKTLKEAQETVKLPEDGINTSGQPRLVQAPTTTLSEHETAPSIGPMMGPTAPSDIISETAPPFNGTTPAARPLSPYSATRALIHDLTLPPIPNLDIPPSPPGSPSAATSAKFARFLDLKQQGVHFNEKLTRSSALKNPSLLPKLMKFAGIDGDQGQYVSSLPKDVWDPSAFPSWAYKDELAKSQQEVLKRKEDEKSKGQREVLNFVPATSSGESSRGGTPGAGSAGISKGLGKSAAERIMAGLDREKTRSPMSLDGGVKRKEMERRGGKYEPHKSSRERSLERSGDRRRRSRSRSPR